MTVNHGGYRNYSTLAGKEKTPCGAAPLFKDGQLLDIGESAGLIQRITANLPIRLSPFASST